MRDEDRKLAPVSSRELQSHRSQAQHPRSRRNIKQEPGLRGQRQPQLRGAKLHAKQKLSRRQHTTALRRSSRPAPGPVRAWEASLLLRCALGCSAPGVLGRFPWGFSVFTWSEVGLEVGSRVSARGKKPKHLGARDRGDSRAASVPY